MRPAGALSTWANCTLTTVCTFPMFRSVPSLSLSLLPWCMALMDLDTEETRYSYVPPAREIFGV
jgi:hypothetical protein